METSQERVMVEAVKRAFEEELGKRGKKDHSVTVHNADALLRNMNNCKVECHSKVVSKYQRFCIQPKTPAMDVKRSARCGS